MTRHQSQDVRRSQILAAARSCFIETGYDRSRMSEIAQRAGLSKGGVYFHFTSKREIFDALVEREFHKAQRILTDVEETPGAVLERIEVLGERYLGGFSQDPDNTRFHIVISEVALRDEELQRRLHDLHQLFVEGLRQLIDDGVASGELQASEARTAALMLKALFDGLENHHALGEREDPASLLRVAIEIITRGLGAPGNAPSAAIHRRMRPAIEVRSSRKLTD